MTPKKRKKEKQKNKKKETYLAVGHGKNPSHSSVASAIRANS